MDVSLTGLLVGDFIEAILKNFVEMHRLVVAGRHVSEHPAIEGGGVSRWYRARSHPTDVTHTTENAKQNGERCSRDGDPTRAAEYYIYGKLLSEIVALPSTRTVWCRCLREGILATRQAFRVGSLAVGNRTKASCVKTCRWNTTKGLSRIFLEKFSIVKLS